ncbi:MAG: glycerol kinase [Thioclava sp.]|nr:glycerol kinase [Thioclava sp.]|tara:strand:+ start:1540 stop:3024 length:1485 start_codon:yes stop_codon:yes gene_type:complete
MEKMILTIDQGTTGTGVHLVDARGRVRKSFDKEHRQYYPNPGWVEHDANEIWMNVQLGIQNLLKGEKSLKIEAVGITNQRETVVAWSRKSGQPLCPAIVWQCRRTADFCDSLRKKRGVPAKIKRKTGLVVDAYFSASKIRWMLKNVSAVKSAFKEKDLLVGTIDSFLLWKLSGGDAHKTDVTNASRTQLLNLQTQKWDKELLKLFDVPEEILPSVHACNDIFGATKKIPELPDGTPISGMIGDQQSALFGQNCFKDRMAKCTFGTGSFLLMNTGKTKITSKSGLLTTIAWQLDGRPVSYALEGSSFICGAAVQWLRDELKIITHSAEVEEMARKVDSADGVEFVPAFVGLGAPYWNQEARGVISGLTRGTNRYHLCRATLEAMAMQNVDVLEAMEKDVGQKLKILRVDGGATANELLMQLQCDYLGVKVERPKNIESTLMGATFMAGLGVGFWKSLDEIQKIKEMDKVFQPEMTKAQRVKRKASWKTAIARAAL